MYDDIMDAYWKKFVKSVVESGFEFDNPFNYWGLCGIFHGFSKKNNCPYQYSDAMSYCIRRIARYRHKPETLVPWIHPIVTSPAPRIRFIQYEAKRLGIK